MKLSHWVAIAVIVSTPFQITFAQTADSSANPTNQNIQVLIQRINELEEKFGFTNLYNLKGGITAYLQEVGEKTNA